MPIEPDQNAITPTEQLAELICKQLASEGLIQESKIADLRAKLIRGQATQDDWRLWVELSQEPAPEAKP